MYLKLFEVGSPDVSQVKRWNKVKYGFPPNFFPRQMFLIPHTYLVYNKKLIGFIGLISKSGEDLIFYFSVVSCLYLSSGNQILQGCSNLLVVILLLLQASPSTIRCQWRELSCHSQVRPSPHFSVNHVVKFKASFVTFKLTTAVLLSEQCGFDSVPDLFNGQTVNFILKLTK